MEIFNHTIHGIDAELVLHFWESPEPEKEFYSDGILIGINQKHVEWLSSKKTVDIKDRKYFKHELFKALHYSYQNKLREDLSVGLRCDILKDRIKIKCESCGYTYKNKNNNNAHEFACPDIKYYAILEPIKEEEDNKLKEIITQAHMAGQRSSTISSELPNGIDPSFSEAMSYYLGLNNKK